MLSSNIIGSSGIVSYELSVCLSKGGLEGVQEGHQGVFQVKKGSMVHILLGKQSMTMHFTKGQ